METKTIKTIRLKGKITDLIPLGWKFRRLFGRNYICYNFGYCEHSTQLWFWKHHGGYLEVRDYHDDSHVIWDYIASGAYKATQNPGVFKALHTPSRRLNQETGALEEPSETNDALYFMTVCDRRGEDYKSPENKAHMDKINEKYREVTFPENLIKAIEQFKHLFEVKEETLKI